MPDKLTFAFNTPVRVALIDPLGEYDDELRQGTFQTTAGQWFTLPRPAVELLYGLDPRPGEEVQITRYWSGKPKERITWDICLTPSSEQIRAGEEIAASEAQEPPEHAEAPPPARHTPRRQQKPVEPIRRKPAAHVDQPRLFDQRGTGTDGPAPQLAPRPGAIPLPAVARKTPYGQMLRHIVRTVEAVLKAESLQLGDGPKQDLVSTIYIDAAKRSGIEYDFSEEAK